MLLGSIDHCDGGDRAPATFFDGKDVALALLCAGGGVLLAVSYQVTFFSEHDQRYLNAFQVCATGAVF